MVSCSEHRPLMGMLWFPWCVTPWSQEEEQGEGTVLQRSTGTGDASGRFLWLFKHFLALPAVLLWSSGLSLEFAVLQRDRSRGRGGILGSGTEGQALRAQTWQLHSPE